MSDKRQPSNRVLIVGWDGGTWDAFGPLVERGLMPNLKALMTRGCHGVLHSTVPAWTPPAWTTLITGLNPERHGIFAFFENMLIGDAVIDDDRAMRPVSSLSIRHPTLFSIFSAAGRPVMSINLPMSYPPTPINGIMVTGLFTPSDAEDYTYPAALKSELEDYIIDRCNGADWLTRALRAGMPRQAAAHFLKSIRTLPFNPRQVVMLAVSAIAALPLVDRNRLLDVVRK
ncbi:MAG TPA: alkaline phosphatase family protein [Planctomycetota bacterium]|nr:alkaline phosphatase family protein [Planctomycetota bacterium]